MARLRGLSFIALPVVLALVGCSATQTLAPPTPSPSPPRATSFLEFRDAFCGSWSSLFRAVGNPDTGTGSELSLALDAAARAADSTEVNRLAGLIHDELEAGRRHTAFAAGWSPAAPMMAEMDRFLVALETAIEAERAGVEAGNRDAVSLRGAAFEQAGGFAMWERMLQAGGPLMSARPDGPAYQCPGIPVSI